jgi:CMP-N-acetylneuraminic acid synthetase
MKTAFKNAMVVSLVAMASATAIAQTVKNGELSGTHHVSKSVIHPSRQALPTVYTTPAAGYFVITQAMQLNRTTICR